METRANYALIGAFTLAVIFAAFGFVFWFSGPSKATSRSGYNVIFQGSVAGLSRGGAVTFNGLRVGDVTSLGINPDDPGEVIAHIEVDKHMPVKDDTRMRLEYSGLTGVASLALYGGSKDAPERQPKPNETYPTFRADSSQFQSLLESAQRIGEQLGTLSDKANKLIDQNSDAINKTISNIQDTTAALADKTDGLGPLLANLNRSSGKLDHAIDGVSKMFATDGDAHKTIVDIGDAARSVRRLADNINNPVREILANIARFSGSGLRQYEALATDGRKTLDDISHAVRSLERDPSQIIFGAKPALPEYKAK
ncbi:MAG: MCE family protein [Hyphomicrobiales bacterium]|nr:MCE family protein [Hyphomicrobiales bacterium]